MLCFLGSPYTQAYSLPLVFKCFMIAISVALCKGNGYIYSFTLIWSQRFLARVYQPFHFLHHNRQTWLGSLEPTLSLFYIFHWIIVQHFLDFDKIMFCKLVLTWSLLHCKNQYRRHIHHQVLLWFARNSKWHKVLPYSWMSNQAV